MARNFEINTFVNLEDKKVYIRCTTVKNKAIICDVLWDIEANTQIFRMSFKLPKYIKENKAFITNQTTIVIDITNRFPFIRAYEMSILMKEARLKYKQTFANEILAYHQANLNRLKQEIGLDCVVEEEEITIDKQAINALISSINDEDFELSSLKKGIYIHKGNKENIEELPF